MDLYGLIKEKVIGNSNKEICDEDLIERIINIAEDGILDEVGWDEANLELIDLDNLIETEIKRAYEIITEFYK